MVFRTWRRLNYKGCLEGTMGRRRPRMRYDQALDCHSVLDESGCQRRDHHMWWLRSRSAIIWDQNVTEDVSSNCIILSNTQSRKKHRSSIWTANWDPLKPVRNVDLVIQELVEAIQVIKSSSAFQILGTICYLSPHAHWLGQI